MPERLRLAIDAQGCGASLAWSAADDVAAHPSSFKWHAESRPGAIALSVVRHATCFGSDAAEPHP
jgi:hypothetical protein